MEHIFRNYFSQISEHPELKTETLIKYEHAPWDLHKLSHHPNFKLEWMLEIDDFDCDKDYYPSQWDFDAISQHPELKTESLYLHNLHKLSHHPNFKLKWMHKIGFDPDYNYPSQWDFDVISQHPEFKTESFRLYEHGIFKMPNSIRI